MQINLEKTDVVGIIAINAEDKETMSFLKKYLGKKEVIGIVDCSELTKEENDYPIDEVFRDEKLDEHAVLDFTAIGNPDFKTCLNNLKGNISASLSEDDRDAFDHMINSKWSLIFMCKERFDKKSEELLYGICNKMEGFCENDFEVVDIR